MKRLLQRFALAVALLVGLTVTNVSAQGPYSAQIQAALRSFLTIAHTWTATQTFTDITVGGTCTGCGAGGSPGGSDTQVQFNNMNAFGGSSLLTWDGAKLASKAFSLPATTSSTIGVIFQGGNPFIQTYKDALSNNGNIFIGQNAGNFTINTGGGGVNIGTNNTVLGYEAAADLTTAYKNVVIGVHGMQFATACNVNVAIGSNTLANCTAGGGNIAIGENDLINVGTTSNDVAIGSSAMDIGVSGGSNVAIGNQAARNITGSYNVAVGQGAGTTGLKGGTFNATVGAWSMRDGSAGNPCNNSVLGFWALAEIQTCGNVAVGFQAGTDVNGTNKSSVVDTNMVFIGQNATRDASIDRTTVLTNSVAIGSLATVAASNTVVLGNSSMVQTYLFGDLTTGGAALSVANVGANSCGTTAATVAGNSNAGEITVGATSGTQCRVAFPLAAVTKRECTVTDATTTVATRATYVDSTHTDFLGSFTAGDVVAFICLTR